VAPNGSEKRQLGDRPLGGGDQCRLRGGEIGGERVAKLGGSTLSTKWPGFEAPGV
jgi:hypothetical protein